MKLQISNISVHCDPASTPFLWERMEELLSIGYTFDNIVIWTKNPEGVVKLGRSTLDKLIASGTNFFSQVTITGYEKHVEKGVPSYEDVISYVPEYSKYLSLNNKIRWRVAPIFEHFNMDQSRFNSIRKVFEEVDYNGILVDTIIADNIDTDNIKIITQEFINMAVKYTKVYSCIRPFELGIKNIIPANCYDWVNKYSSNPLSKNLLDKYNRYLNCYKYVSDPGFKLNCGYNCTYCYETT